MAFGGNRLKNTKKILHMEETVEVSTVIFPVFGTC